MNRKLKNTLALVVLLILITIAGGAYILFIQRGNITEKKSKLKELKANDYNTVQLTAQYQGLEKKAAVLDSVLASRKFNIPQNLSSIKFFNFVNSISAGFSPETQINLEFLSQNKDKNFLIYQYKITGTGRYTDYYKLIYGIEQSKELKKIKSVTITNLVSSNKDGMPVYLISFTIMVNVYYSNDNRFATSELVENDLTARSLYDVFYPLIRNEIPPNVNNLLDVQGAKLLALIPEGAFLADTKGNTYLLWEGEQVYLGYLTKIDYEHNKVHFILNKGGIIEKVELGLEKENDKSLNH